MRLLLVEDDKLLIDTLKPTLKKAGFAVDVANDGKEAEFKGNQNGYDIVVLDIGLPLKSGIDVLKAWRAMANAVPVLLLTARDAWHEKVDGFKAGADDYLSKPFHVEELIVRINAITHRANQKPGGNILVAGISLDEQQQSVTLDNNKLISLTGTEFRMLRYFLLHPNRVVSKSTLLEHVYDFDSDKDSNVIEVYIKRIRKIIGKERIETRRGQGYVFKDPP
ncbi:MAG: response regulator transcription factor [Thiohalomonadales bacterium]